MQKKVLMRLLQTQLVETRLQLSLVCIDEQMIPFTGKTSLKQYVPCKPNPEGIKNFVLATRDGLVLDFEPYQGQKLCSEDLDGKPCTLPESVVLRLIHSLPPGTSIYFDRYFTSVRLLDHLRVNKRMNGTGTIRKVSIPKDAKLPSEKDLKKKKRGTSVTSVRSDGGLAITVWQDNKPIYMASTEHGSDPEDLVKRDSSSSKSARLRRRRQAARQRRSAPTSAAPPAQLPVIKLSSFSYSSDSSRLDADVKQRGIGAAD
ncbi:piggyBac transposable element-derived protein 3-like [Amphibalanus amphitrite]|uniref:piggyBac transposable element-derived protein 3-like n=1 Tax=Amphibalanus amphitrite TaxID=1232801 RepID=UPI001C915D46|nr:piggyBac transposable element-derived protein 3-like [Amphibalanus amphitrite]